jgi:hypothetical protein
MAVAATSFASAAAADTPAVIGGSPMAPSGTARAVPSGEHAYTAVSNGVQFDATGPRALTAMDTCAACGISDDMHKLVREFPRAAGPGFAAGVAQLECGTENYGYRHIASRHMQDWTNVALLVRSDWRSFADWAIEQVLAAPDSVTYNSGNDT